MVASVKPKIALWVVTSGRVTYPEKEIWVWFHVYYAHRHSPNKWIIASSADLQNEECGDLTFPNLRKSLFR